MTSRDISPGSPSIDDGLLLALNAAEGRLQLALGQTEAQAAPHLLHAQEWSAPNKAMGLLAPSLQHAFSLLFRDESPKLKGIACVRGPGNFTGLRLCLATALGLSRSMQAPLAGLDYLPLLADNAWRHLPLQGRGTASIWVLTHARGGEVYVQGFATSKGSEPEALAPPVAATVAEALELLASAPLPGLVLGSGLRRNVEAFAALPDGIDALSSEWDHPAPLTLLRHAATAGYSMAAPAPLYLRDSDAEENLEHIARKQGRDPKAMRTDLERLRKELGDTRNQKD